ncbi:MAG: glutathione S-transferase family protein, partial [Hyphomicrobiales bacterium]|nr:glutathione S-transferase family protein [Hyphomicrobiales bacterium]
RASTALWMLEEIGAPYELKLLRMKKGEHKSPDYLAINPMGKVPAIQHHGVTVTESSAICAYLADAFPHANLAPALTDPNRGAYYRWMFFAPSCIEPVMAEKAFKRPPVSPQSLGYGDFDSVMTTLSAALSDMEYVAGDRFTAADLVLGATLNFGMMFDVIPKRDVFISYTQRLTARDAYKRSRERENELAAQIEGEI